MNSEQMRELADRLTAGTHYVDSPGLHEAMMKAADFLHQCAEQRQWADDLRTVVTMLEGMADEKPALWMQSNHVSWAGKQPFMARCAPTQLHPDFVPVYLRPAPQSQPVLSGYGDYGAAIPGIERPCTCHPDDNPPVLCARQYSLNECRAASGEPTEAWQLLADLVAGLEATHWSSWQTTAHFDSALDAARAALAAKQEK